MQNSINQIQQGDVLIQRVNKLPEGVKKLNRENGRLIVAKGEQTGHAHVIDSTLADLWILEKDGISQMYLEVAAPVTIDHDEHKPLEIPTGIYKIGTVQEYDYFKEMRRNVRD